MSSIQTNNFLLYCPSWPTASFLRASIIALCLMVPSHHRMHVMYHLHVYLNGTVRTLFNKQHFASALQNRRYQIRDSANRSHGIVVFLPHAAFHFACIIVFLASCSVMVAQSRLLPTGRQARISASSTPTRRGLAVGPIHRTGGFEISGSANAPQSNGGPRGKRWRPLSIGAVP